MLITLALGTWVAGELAAEASRAVARKSQYKLTVATPGLNLEETLKLIQKLATFYQQTVLVGYPPFIKDLLEKGSNRGLDWPSLTIKVLTGGEGHSENWRNWVMDKIGSKNPQDILNLFGLAEAGILGFETPLTVHLRRKAHADQQLSQALFGTSQSLPSLMQYNPLARFLEEKDGELLLTANLGLPLVRYNLHDRGRLIALKSLPAGYLENPHWQIPLFCVFGRSDAATLYGVNIYTDNVQAGLEDPGLAETNTGQFKMKTVFDRDQNQALQVAVELKSQAPLSKELEQRYTQVLTETLRQKNSEYSRLYQEKKTQVEPRVKLIESGTQEFAEPVSVKRKYLDST